MAWRSPSGDRGLWVSLEFSVDLGVTRVITDAERHRDWVGGALQVGAPSFRQQRIAARRAAELDEHLQGHSVDYSFECIPRFMLDKGTGRNGYRIGADRKADRLGHRSDAAAGAQSEAGVKVKGAGVNVKLKLAAKAGERYAEAKLADKGMEAPARESGLKGAWRRGEIGGLRGACDIGAAGGIDRDASAFVVTRSAQVGGVEQGRAGGVELADKGITEEAPAESGLERIWGCGEIIGIRKSSDIAIARGVDPYAKARIVATSAEEGGVEQRRAGGVQLADERILTRGTGLERARRGREVAGSGNACDIGVARDIDRYAGAAVAAEFRPGKWSRAGPSRWRSAC